MRAPRSKITKSVAAAAVVALGMTAGSLSSASAQTHAVRPTMSKSVPPNPRFLETGICGTSGVSDTSTCNAAIFKAINAARTSIGVANVRPSFSLSAFDALNNDEQIFTIANMERAARGLSPISGLTAQLNAVALSAAKAQRDPSTSLPLRLTGGGEAYYYGSNFAEGTANGTGADYFWMYDDGLNSPNADCTTSNESGCWGHRDNILAPYSSASYCAKGSKLNIVMGAAEQTTGVPYDPAVTEIFTNDCGVLPTMDFTWTQAQQLVFGT
jgi:uncharacterized protein YkwD